jgi:hypothetical protein
VFDTGLLEDLDADDPAFVVVHSLRTLWPKEVRLTPDTATLFLRRPDGTRYVLTDVTSDLWVFLDGEQEVGPLSDILKSIYHAEFATVADAIGLAEITQDTERSFVISAEPLMEVNGEERRLYVLAQATDPHELQEILRVGFRGKAMIHVCEITLQHKRLGEVTVAYGEGKLGDRPILAVASLAEGGARVTLRDRPGTPSTS